MGVDTLVKMVYGGIKSHKSEIMIGIGIVSGAGAIFAAVKETPKCLETFKEAELAMPVTVEKDENGVEKEVRAPLSWKTKIVIFGKSYWLAGALEAFSIFCILYGTKIKINAYTALVTAYGLKKAELDDIMKTISEHPEGWRKKFAEKRAEMHLNESDPKDIPEPRMSNADVPMPLPLFFDDQAKVYFRCSEEELRDAVAEFTHMISTDPFQATSMNDWMDIIGHEHVVQGDYYLMSMHDSDWDGPLKYNQIGVKEAPNGEPARTMTFSKEYHLDTRGMYSEV